MVYTLMCLFTQMVYHPINVELVPIKEMVNILTFSFFVFFLFMFSIRLITSSNEKFSHILFLEILKSENKVICFM